MLSIPKHLAVRLASMKVLVIDDHPHMRKVVRTMLIGLGVRNIYEASDGAEGINSTLQTKPDVTLVDWDMPVVDGLEFIRRVRTPGEFPFPDLPIILLTAHAERWRVVEAARYGVHEYLLKPISTQALVTRIAGVLEKPRQMMKLDGHYVPEPRAVVVLDAQR